MTPTAPGTYWLVQADQIQEVAVVLDAGVLCARFIDDDGHAELVPVADLAGEWELPDDEVPAHQRDQPYFVRLAGVDGIPDAERIKLENAFRVAFNKVCGDAVLRVVFAHGNGDEDILDPRAGGPGFYDDLERQAVKLMDARLPEGAFFHCAYNYAREQL